MKKHHITHQLIARRVLFLVLVLIICLVYSYFVPPRPVPMLPLVLSVLAMYGAAAICFFPELRPFISLCTGLKNSDEDKVITACNFLVALTPVSSLILRADTFLRLMRYKKAKVNLFNRRVHW